MHKKNGKTAEMIVILMIFHYDFDFSSHFSKKWIINIIIITEKKMGSKKLNPKPYQNLKMDKNLTKNTKFWWKSVKNPLKNTKIVSFDKNPEFWSTEKNRAKKAKP